LTGIPKDRHSRDPRRNIFEQIQKFPVHTEFTPGRARLSTKPWPTGSVSAHMPSFETAARSLKVEPIIAPVHSDYTVHSPLFGTNEIKASSQSVRAES
jgi:hypothetical protein